MSVVVKGMEMPENCDVCMFSDWSNLSQTASCKLKEYEPCFADFSNEYKNKRADFCPLVALPDKHGDLIDRVEAYDCIAEQEGGNYVDMDTVGKGLECATIIIEAEGEE